ncbi:MAG: carboxypeptidase-like regulatory domain-containing protein, partial [Motiliproteus sp.]
MKIIPLPTNGLAMRAQCLPLYSYAFLCYLLAKGLVLKAQRKIVQSIILLGLLLLSGQLFAATLSGVIYGGSALLENAVVTLLDAGQQPVAGKAPVATNASGAYQFASLADGNYYLTVTPPAGSGYGSVSPTLVALPGSDVEQDFVLVSGAVTLSGVISDHTGAALAGARVKAYQQVDTSWVQVGQEITVGADGSYEWSVSAGNYYLYATFNYSQVDLEGEPYSAEKRSADFSVTTNSGHDIQFDFVVLSGLTVDSNGVPVPGVELRTTKYWEGPESGAQGMKAWRYIAHNYAKTISASDGSYLMVLYPTDTCIGSGYYSSDADCLYDITIVPPSGSNFVQSYQKDLAITSDTNNNNIVLESGQTLSGVVRDHTGAPLAGVHVKAYQQVDTSWVQVG